MTSPDPSENQSQGSLSKEDIQMCARAARLAYFTQEEVEKPQYAEESKRLILRAVVTGFKLRESIICDNHVAWILSGADAICIAFRGTSVPKDWITNLNILPKHCSWGFSHRGFVGATERIWPHLLELLPNAQTYGRRLFLTGHSLGGAMATVAALKFVYELGGNVEGLVTFGQPPLLGRRWRGTRGNAGITSYERYVNSVDIVVTAPFFPYFGHGSLHYIDARGDEHTRFSFVQFLTDAAYHGWKLRPSAQVGNHPMNRYLEYLEVI